MSGLPVTRPANRHQVSLAIPFDQATETVLTSFTIWSAFERSFRLSRIFYNSPTGFAANASAYWTISLTDGTNTLASWSTQTTAQGTLSANTPVNLVIAAAADLAPGKSLILTLTPSGSPAGLPAGRIVVDGKYL